MPTVAIEQGEDNLPPGLPAGAAVDCCGFFQCQRDVCLDRTMEHKDRHRDREANVHQDQRDSVVQYVQDTAVDRHQRNHQDLERNNHRRDHQREDQRAEFPSVVTHNDKSSHGGDHNRQNRGAAGDDEGVSEHRPEIHLLHCIGEVVQREAVCTDQCKRIFDDITFGLEHIDHDHDEREDKAEEQKKQYNPHNCVGDFFLPRSSFVFSHYASTSPLLPTMTWVTPTIAQTRNRITASAWPRP